MEIKHTPGPWEKGKGNTITKSDGLKITLKSPQAAAPEAETEERISHDARLIAAAPELLEALIELRDFYRNFTGMPAAKANSVIKKALGQ